MKTLLLLFFSLSGSALAGTANMVAQCEEVMRCEICRVANDVSTPATKIVSYLDAQGKPQARRVLAADYDYIRNTGYEKTSQGKFLMCERVAKVMRRPKSEQAAGARALFSATWQRQTYCP